MESIEYELKIEELITGMVEARQRYESSMPMLKQKRFLEWQILRQDFSRFIDANYQAETSQEYELIGQSHQ